MTQNRDFFTPESVDEQIEQFSSHLSDKPARMEPEGASSQAQARYGNDFPVGKENKTGQGASTRLIRELQALYQADYQQNRTSLVHARQRIAAQQSAHYDTYQGRNHVDSTPELNLSQERTRKMHYPHSTEQSGGKKLSRSLSLLAAVLIAGLLVSTLAMLLTFNHGQQGIQGTTGKKTTAASVPTPTPTSVPTGTVLYTHHAPAGMNLASSAAWSPDGKRVASLAISQATDKSQVDIWDAASGRTLMTIPLSAKSLNEVLWSPTGKYLALDSLQTIVIVDSQSGAVVKTINYQAPTTFNTPGTSQPWLSSDTPLGGGFGFYSVAWTPDGASLGVTVSNITNGKVVLLDPLTGAVKTTFSAQAEPIGSPLAFSSDGKYVAVSYLNDFKVVVWNVATQQVVFVLGNQIQSMFIGWQPGTHNLARSTSFPVTVQLWDVDTKAQIKTYQDVAEFAWSPDGKQLATYASPFDQSPLSKNKYPQNNKVTILNAATGTQIGLYYTSQNRIISAASWSPDGRLIATGEDLNDTQIVVWAA